MDTITELKDIRAELKELRDVVTSLVPLKANIPELSASVRLLADRVSELREWKAFQQGRAEYEDDRPLVTEKKDAGLLELISNIIKRWEFWLCMFTFIIVTNGKGLIELFKLNK